jgi:hypothetical protein
MADTKISAMTNAAALDGTELVPLVQGGANVKATTQDIADLAGAGGIPSAISTGTDTYFATIAGVTTLSQGDAFVIEFGNANTGSSTIDISGTGNVALYKNKNAELAAGDIQAGQIFILLYDGANFQMIGIQPNQLFAYVRNADSVTLNKGDVVYAFGATGNKMSVKLASNGSDATSAKTVGVVYSSTIAVGGLGFVITQGVCDGLNLGTFTAGDTVYLSSIAGEFTATKPYAPEHLVYVGIVERANNGDGLLFVRVQNGYEMDELHNVQAQSPADNSILLYDSGDSQWKAQLMPVVIQLAASDETSALTTGTAKITFRMPYAMTLSEVRASLTTAQSAGNIFTVDINEAGTSILSTKLTIDNTEKTSTTAATPAVISDTALADDAEITIDIDQIGTSGATGLKVTLIGTRVS